MFFSIQENYELLSKKCEIIHIEHTVRVLELNTQVLPVSKGKLELQ